MEVTILASGSKGNAAYIEDGDTAILIDAGISYRQITLRMGEKANRLASLEGIIVSHEHSDHTKGLEQTLKRTMAPVYTAKKTYTKIKDKLPMDHTMTPIEEDVAFMVGSLIITPLKTSHDAAHSLGFIIETNSKQLVFITDTGFLQEDDFHRIRNAHMYVLESNYDVALLFDSARPFYLKKRIDSVRGHLSNADSAYYLTQLIGPRTHSIVLAHPSQECNTESYTLATLHDVFAAYDKVPEDYDIHVAKQHQPSKVFKI